MNYKRIYNSIIDNRRSNPLDESKYGEWHHIIPRSLDGTDEPENLVRLSAREHFICHALLAEMYEEGSNEWYKMNHAFMMMKCSSILHDSNRYFNSRLYEHKRKDFSKVMSESQAGSNNSQYGKPRTERTKRRISESIRKTLGITLTKKEKKELERKKVKEKYTTKDGTFVGTQRRNNIKKFFGVDLSKDFNNNFEKLRKTLYELYVVDKKSTIEVSKIYNTNDETIRNYLKFFNIKRRNLSEALKNYSN